jgi:hypothetical protein
MRHPRNHRELGKPNGYLRSAFALARACPERSAAWRVRSHRTIKRIAVKPIRAGHFAFWDPRHSMTVVDPYTPDPDEYATLAQAPTRSDNAFLPLESAMPVASRWRPIKVVVDNHGWGGFSMILAARPGILPTSD